MCTFSAEINTFWLLSFVESVDFEIAAVVSFLEKILEFDDRFFFSHRII